MSKNDKRADEIIEETMRELYGDLHKYEIRDSIDEDDFDEDGFEEFDEDDYEEISHRKAKKTHAAGYDEKPDYEDFEDFEGEEGEVESDAVKEASKAYKKRRRKKKAGKVIGTIVGILAVVYIGIALYFGSHFMFYTKINGNDVALKSVSQVESKLKKDVGDYVLTLKESDGSTEEIDGSDISLEYVQSDELAKCIKQQNNFLWIISLWNHPQIEASVGVKYDKEALADEVSGLNCMDKKNQTKSKNAYPKFMDTRFEIETEVIGTEIDEDAFNEAIKEALDGFQSELDLTKEGCYIKPDYTKDSQEVKDAAEKMNSYLGAKVTYDFSPKTEVVDSSVISQWVKVNKKMKVKFDKDAVKKYIQSLASKYNTRGKTRTFKTATGNTVKVDGGDYGWCIAQDSEYKELTKNIKKGETVTREPKYLSKAASHDTMDMGDTYAEVDLTNQRAYFIKKGKVVLSTDVVTGNPNKGNATPPGVYSLTYKTKNATLRGERRPDGTYSYETPVKYWMPFNGGIGFHDASWQPTFGGSRYKSHGSHGCVNLPPSVAPKMYELVYKDVPVVCHN